MIVVDTSGILAAFDSAEPEYARASRSLLQAAPPLLLSPFIAAEVDYLLQTRLGAAAELVFLEDIANRAYALESFGAEDVRSALNVLAQYQDLNIGLADASMVVLAHRYDTLDVLTLDERHFRALRGPGGRRFRILPADE